MCGVLHRRFYELEGRGWQHQLVVPEKRRQDLLQRMHEGAIGAHLGTTCTLALVEQGFFRPVMHADMSRVCRKCDCALLKKRRARREPLHQYIMGVPMERLAMDVAGPSSITSLGKPVLPDGGMLFLEMARVFPHSGTEGHDGSIEIGV